MKTESNLLEGLSKNIKALNLLNTTGNLGLQTAAPHYLKVGFLVINVVKWNIKSADFFPVSIELDLCESNLPKVDFCPPIPDKKRTQSQM